jgi:hypothetical protein
MASLDLGGSRHFVRALLVSGRDSIGSSGSFDDGASVVLPGFSSFENCIAKIWEYWARFELF